MQRLKWLTAGLVLLTATVTWAKDNPVAVMTEIQPAGGEVHVALGKVSEWVTPKPLQALRVGDQVRVTGDGRVVLVYNGGRGPRIVTQENSPFTVEARGDVPASDRVKTVLSNVIDFLLGPQRERRYVEIVARVVADHGFILAPRNTKVISGAPLTFEWDGLDRLRYTVRLLGAQGVVWQQTDISGSTLVYTGPTLVFGERYAFELGTEGYETRLAKFEVLRARDARRIRESLAVLTDAARDYPPSTLVLMRAALLCQEKLYADARRELLNGIAKDAAQAPLHDLLGHVYDRTGLTDLAAKEFFLADTLASQRRGD